MDYIIYIMQLLSVRKINLIRQNNDCNNVNIFTTEAAI